jgi:putative addiction module killer protein
MKAARPFRVREYLTDRGANPYREWLDGLDVRAKARVQARVLRFESGNLGDYKSVGGGVLESRLDFGPGYRVYFGIDEGDLVLLLVGGTKRTQRRDIRQALDYWAEYVKGT